MGPWPEDQSGWPALGARQTEIVLDRCQRIRIVPARQMHGRDVGIGAVIALGVDPRLLPEFVEIAVRPLLEQVALVFGRGADRRIPLVPCHPPEPAPPPPS